MSEPLDLSTAWDRVLTSLERSDVAPHQMALLGLTRPLGLVEDTVLIAAPNEFTQNFLESRLRPRLTEQLCIQLGREVRIAVTVEAVPDTSSPDLLDGANVADYEFADDDPSIPVVAHVQRPTDQRPADGHPDGQRPAGSENAGADSHNVRSLTDHSRRAESADDAHSTGAPPPDGDGRVTPMARVRPRPHPAARLNPKYTFDSFVIGNSNRFAHAAAFAVAEVRAYNPMFIYGESGLGKTHLLHAIGHYSETVFPHHRVNYFTTEEFTNDFINLVHAGRAEDFRRRYRDVDLLLVDDVQFLERAERTQEEFFHTFNTLHNANKQIVISSDRPPKQLTTLEDRLRTRFEWGLITDVQAPDLETRIAILRKKVAGDVLPEVAPEVLEYIASKIQTNIRELEGALIRVSAYASLSRTEVSIGLAEEVLRDLLPDTEGPKITATIIMSVTAEYYSVTVDDLKGHNRSRVLVTARQIAMYLCRELTELSLPRIGQIFGGKDHTTVMHAVRKISALMAERLQIFNQVTELTSRIKARARQ
ncbi:MAG: chromosomal replication initiator protein DnaA [Geodermatophilaceae bacterium]